MKSTVFTTAWAYLKKGLYDNMSDALKAAWSAYKMRKALVIGQVSFTFRKANGEIREAIGTLNTDLFDYEFKGSGRAPKLDVIEFYDLEKKAWRSYRIERFIKAA